MYPRGLSGVVIPDEYYDEEAIVVADSPHEQVYQHQQYGDDGILDGAEGFGVMQAKALKAKLTRGRAGRRRLAVGRAPMRIVGGSVLYDGFGVAPAVVAGATTLATGGRVLGVSFKKPSPRYKGGPLLSTVNGKRAAVERGDMAVVQELERLRRGVGTEKKHVAGWSGVWRELLPTWRYNAQQYAYIKQADPSWPGMPPSPTGVIAVPTTPTLLPSPISTGTPAPAPAAPVDATGAPAPVIISQIPSPSPIPGGYAPTASEQVATATQEEGVQVQQAGMFGGIDPKMLLIGGGLLLLTTMFGGKGGGNGGRSRRRRR